MTSKILIEKEKSSTIVTRWNTTDPSIVRKYIYNQPVNLILERNSIVIQSKNDYPQIVFTFEELDDNFGMMNITEVLKYLYENGFFAFNNILEQSNFNGTVGALTYSLISAATTNLNVVRDNGGNLGSIIAIGLTSDVRFLKIYNKASEPILSTDVPKLIIPIPANTQGAGVAISFKDSIAFNLGISIAITSGFANNDTGAIGAGDVIVNLIHN